MARDALLKVLSGEILEEARELTLAEFCQACRVPAERVLELVAEGVIEPLGREPRAWRFRAVCIRRVRRVQRLERDLGLNVAGAALALELIEEIERLRARLERLDR